jgi:hypothetical protein
MFLRIVPKLGFRFAPLERGGSFLDRALYKHIVPTGRGTVFLAHTRFADCESRRALKERLKEQFAG